MQKISNLFLTIFLLLIWISCSQHYPFKKEIEIRKSGNVSIEKFNNQQSQIIDISKNDSLYLNDITASVDTPKPYIIKKITIEEERNLIIKDTEEKRQSSEFQKPKEKEFPLKILIGILLMVVGALGIFKYYTYRYSSSYGYSYGYSSSQGCVSILSGMLGVVTFIPGLIIFIMGVTQN